MMDILKTYREKIIKVSSLFLTMALMPTAILMVSNESKRESAKVQNIVDEVKFKDLSNNKEFSMSENEFLCGALAAEMPVEFDFEALKAQVVAIRSYLYNKSDSLKNALSLNSKNGNFGISNFCFCSYEKRKEKFGNHHKEYEQKIKEAVEAVSGQYLEYNGQPALTLFFTSCYKRTNSCESIFGGNYPYLISVESNEFDEEYMKDAHVSKKAFYDYKTVKSDDLKQCLKSFFTNEDHFEKTINKLKCGEWITDIEKSKCGTVKNLKVLDQKINGHKLRMSLKLRSTNFDMKYDKERDEFEFNTRGFGHGVGMSQCGADQMAKNGKKYEEILAHYYPETRLISK